MSKKNNNRIKTPLAIIAAPNTIAEVEVLVREIAVAANQKKSLEAAKAYDILFIDKSYSDSLKDCEEEMKLRHAAVQAWAVAHPEEFAKKKTLQFASGSIGFRTGTPALKLLGKKNTLKKLLERLNGVRWGLTYIRTKQEVNKELIIADVGSRRLTDVQLLGVGAAVVQDETFFVDPKLTKTEERQVTQAVAA